jgi:hypothetical protein
MEAPTDLYEPIISSLSPTGHVNLLLDVKVISSRSFVSLCLKIDGWMKTV